MHGWGRVLRGREPDVRRGHGAGLEQWEPWKVMDVCGGVSQPLTGKDYWYC